MTAKTPDTPPVNASAPETGTGAVPEHDPAPAIAGLPVGDSPDWRIWLGLGITVAWLCMGVLYVGESIGWANIGAQPADVIGNFLEGAFAPLAFLWLVIGYFLQQKELAQNTDALRLQFREIQRSAEQAVKQTETIAAAELHARQETFLKINEQVRRQLGSIMGMLFISSQASGDEAHVSDEEVAQLWTALNQGDPDAFSRRMIALHFETESFDERLELFYGTEIRARHTNNFIFTLERLQARARAADTDGILEDAITGSAHGFVYKLALQYRAHAPVEFADVAITGRDVRMTIGEPEMKGPEAAAPIETSATEPRALGA